MGGFRIYPRRWEEEEEEEEGEEPAPCAASGAAPRPASEPAARWLRGGRGPLALSRQHTATRSTRTVRPFLCNSQSNSSSFVLFVWFGFVVVVVVVVVVVELALESMSLDEFRKERRHRRKWNNSANGVKPSNHVTLSQRWAFVI